jgi:hypothetical protein
VKEEDAITMQEGKHGMKKLSMLNTFVFNNVSHIFFSIGQPTMDHENVHLKMLQMCTLKLLCLQD